VAALGVEALLVARRRSPIVPALVVPARWPLVWPPIIIGQRPSLRVAAPLVALGNVTLAIPRPIVVPTPLVPMLVTVQIIRAAAVAVSPLIAPWLLIPPRAP